jgi:site-specific recombinase XerD
MTGKLHNTTVHSFAKYTKDFFDYETCPFISYKIFHGNSYSRAWAKRQKKLLNFEITPFFDTRQMNSITFKEIDDFIISLKKKNYSNKKLNHGISTLKNIFSYAEMTGLIQTNPCKRIKPFKITTPEKGIIAETFQ